MNGCSRMRDSDFRVASGDKLDELAQALEEGDHGHVEPAILEQARDGEIARTVPEWVEGGGIGGDDELRGKREGKNDQVHQHTILGPSLQLVTVPWTQTEDPPRAPEERAGAQRSRALTVHTRRRHFCRPIRPLPTHHHH